MPNANIEPELNSLLSKLTIEIEADSKEIEIRKKRIEKNEALLRAVKGSLGALHPDTDTAGYGSKRQTILEAIDGFGKQQFTQDDVEAELKRLNPAMEINRDRIRSALWTLSRNGKINQIRKGTNQELALYEKNDGIVRTKRTTEAHKEQTLKNAAIR